MGMETAKDVSDQAFTREDMKGPGLEATFGGALSFLRRKYTRDLAGVDLAITGIPFDQAVTNRPGTRFGPRAKPARFKRLTRPMVGASTI